MTNPKTPLIKHLIVTRPKDQADQLMAKLSEVIDETITLKHLPLMRIEPIKFDTIDLSNFSEVLFISGNAAHYFFAHQQLPPVRLFAVGENTAEQVEKLTRQKVIYPQQMNAEGLLALAELQNVKDQNWLIVKGEGGRTLIYQALLNRGAKVTELDVYQRKLPDFETQQIIVETNLEAPSWLISSAEALNHLYRILDLAEKPEHQTSLIVSSDRLKNLALQKGFRIIGQSQGASETQLVECVQALIQDQKIPFKR